jgi:DNA-binding NtrC family response regulator
VPRCLVLVADSHRDCRETMAEVLRMEGHGVCTAVDYEAALHNLQWGDIDLLLVDCRLRGCDAPAFVRSEEAASAGRVILMATHLGQTGGVRSARLTDRVFVVPKPIHFATLQLLLHELVPAKPASRMSSRHRVAPSERHGCAALAR